MIVLGIDIGGTNTELGVLNSEKGIIEVSSFKTKNCNSFDGFIKTLLENIKSLHDKYDIQCIGIGAPNFDSQSNQFRPVNFPWSDLRPFNLKSCIEDEFNIATFVVNDANAAGLAENRFGVGKNHPSFIMITVGTGLGGAIVINNELFDGAFGYSGEFGHTKVDQLSRKCNCGGVGCLETVVSANGIKKSYSLNMKNITGVDLQDIPTVKQIFSLAENKNDIAKQTLEFTFQMLGKKLSDFIHILNPQVVVFCGNISKSMHAYMPEMIEECEKHLLEDFRGKVSYKVSDLLDKKMNILGPASLALDKLELAV
ncbi:MAG: ROK family protein [Flavobacteriales bacterium]